MSAPLFDATLTPNRSAGPRLLWAVFLVALALNVYAASVALNHGGVLILPFLGLDLVLLAGAFALHARAQRLSERIVLTAQALDVYHADAQGQRHWRFEPGLTRIELDEAPGAGLRVLIMSSGKGVWVGAFLLPHERRSLAGALRQALAAWRPQP